MTDKHETQDKSPAIADPSAQDVDDDLAETTATGDRPGEALVEEPVNAGAALRAAREGKSMPLEDVAKVTRIPQRHLENLEAGEYDELPGRTYAIGFAKSYARVVDLDDEEIAARVRDEMDAQGHAAYRPETSGYAPADPSNIPPRALAWTAAGIAAVLLIGYLIYRTVFLSPDELTGVEDEPVAETVVEAEADAAPAVGSNGTVVLTATDNVWLQIYEADGERLFQDELEAGEKYTVPTNATEPQILTGRPDALTVTIDGTVVPALGTAEATIKDVGVSAAALLARGGDGAGDAAANEGSQ